MGGRVLRAPATVASVKNHLPALRSERGWTQAQLAKQLGVSRQTIISIERGKYDPSLPLAFKIAQAFGLPIEEIFSGS